MRRRAKRIREGQARERKKEGKSVRVIATKDREVLRELLLRKDKEALWELLRKGKEVRKEVSQIFGPPQPPFPQRPLRRSVRSKEVLIFVCRDESSRVGVREYTCACVCLCVCYVCVRICSTHSMVTIFHSHSSNGRHTHTISHVFEPQKRVCGVGRGFALVLVYALAWIYL